MSKKLAPFKGFNDPKNVSEQYRVVSFRDYESASQLMMDIAKWWNSIEKKDTRILVQTIAFSSFPNLLYGSRRHGADVVCLYQLENEFYDPDPENNKSILIEGHIKVVLFAYGVISLYPLLKLVGVAING